MSKRTFLLVSAVADCIKRESVELDSQIVSFEFSSLEIRSLPNGEVLREREDAFYILKDLGAIVILTGYYLFKNHRFSPGIKIQIVRAQFREVQEEFRRVRKLAQEPSGIVLTFDRLPDEIDLRVEKLELPISEQTEKTQAIDDIQTVGKGGRPKESLPKYKKDAELKRLKIVCKIKGKHELALLKRLFDFLPHEGNSLSGAIDTKDLTSLLSALRKKIKSEKYSIKTYRGLQETTYQLKHPSLPQTNQ